ncbi:MAG: hypothetical protein RLZZ628_249 [Bacteroidota bacterium]
MLKKVTSILLLSLLLFNVVGYFALFAYEQEQARHIQLQEMPNSAFKLVKILASTYVHLENTAFDYPDEQFTVEGKTYNLAKKRILNDTLEIYLLNNVKQDELTAAFKDYMEQNILTKSLPTHKTPFKIALKDFLKNCVMNPSHLFDIRYQTVAVLLEKEDNLALNDSFFELVALSIVLPPPDSGMLAA